MSERHERVVSLLRELVAGYISQEANTDPMITITNVTTSPDYRKVTVYITTIPDGREEDAIVWMKRHGKDMRRHVMKKSNLKIIPHLEFAVDAGEKHRQHTDEVFREIENGDR